MDITQTLRIAKSYVLRGWCKYTWARDKNNKPISVFSDDAVSFCAAGAMLRAMEGTPAERLGAIAPVFTMFHKFLGVLFIGQFNDNATKDDVIELYDALILQSIYNKY